MIQHEYQPARRTRTSTMTNCNSCWVAAGRVGYYLGLCTTRYISTTGLVCRSSVPLHQHCCILRIQCKVQKHKKSNVTSTRTRSIYTRIDYSFHRYLYPSYKLPRLCSVRFVDSGQGYGSLTELPEVLGTGMDVLQNSHKFRVLWHGRTELTEVPGGYKKCCTRTPGCRTGRTNGSSGYGYECCLLYTSPSPRD